MERIIVKHNNETRALSGKEVCQDILGSLEKHTDLRDHSLNLIASENRVSPVASAVLSSDIGNRYTVGPYERWFPGLNNYTEIENHAINLLKETVFGADFVNVEPVSGMVANMTAYHATINRGDSVMVTSEEHGGHYSHRAGNLGVGKKASTLLDMYGVSKVVHLPFDTERYNLDIDGCEKVIKEEKPNVIIIGTSEMLFPAPIKELREIAGPDVQIIYDASHVFGLIVGNNFQQPLVEGANILTTSTNKTLGAACHGLVGWTNEAEAKYGYRDLVGEAMVPLFTSNHHGHHVVSLAVTMAEMKVFGKEYAEHVVSNAKALGCALNNQGLKIVAANYGYTQSHEILIDTQTADSTIGMRILEQANIMVSKCPIPNAKSDRETGLRLGTNEMTRMGMEENDMTQIAKLIADTLFGRSNPAEVAKTVREFRNNFQTQKFCFDIKN